MARRRSRAQRDTSDIANDLEQDLTEALLRPVEPLPSLSFDRHLDEFLSDRLPHDRRLFHFGEPEHYSLITGEVSRGRSGEERSGLSRGVAFGNPRSVAICVRRKERREVLFAKRRVRGRGGPRRRSWYSDIKC